MEIKFTDEEKARFGGMWCMYEFRLNGPRIVCFCKSKGIAEYVLESLGDGYLCEVPFSD